MRIPFTAGRARNAGFRRLRELDAELPYVQFIDGDCEMADDWLEQAANYLDRHSDFAVVCGRNRERNPQQSIYNWLCDMEWDTPVGEAKFCGGNAMLRASAFERIGGFRESMIAGEEPELCVRLRACGWRVWRLDAEMTLHDAAMTRFGQWWVRSVRTGYAYAEGAHLHGTPPEHYGVKEMRSNWFWGFAIPIAALGLAFLADARGLLLLALYPAQIARLTLTGTGAWPSNLLRATFLVLGKFPEAIGQLKFLAHRILRRQGRLIEYK
jgi:hypothetical protein